MEFSTVQVEPPDLSREIHQLPGDTPNPVVKAEPVRAPSATMTMAGNLGVTRRAEASAWAVAERAGLAGAGHAGLAGAEHMEAVAVNGTLAWVI